MSNKNKNDNGRELIDIMINWSANPTSICFKNNNNNNKSNIAIVTVTYLDDIEHPLLWLPLSRMNRIEYSYKFGYDYCEFPVDIDFGIHRKTHWMKLGVLYMILKYYKYVVWIDCDTLFWNKPYKSFTNLLKYFHLNPNADIIFSNHGKNNKRRSPSTVNSGIFIINQSEWSFNFLKQCYTEYVNNSWILNEGHQYDQQAIQAMIEKDGQFGNEHIIILNAEIMQLLYQTIKNKTKYHNNWIKLNEIRDETVILHRTGGGSKKYLQLTDIAKAWTDQIILNNIIQLL